MATTTRPQHLSEAIQSTTALFAYLQSEQEAERTRREELEAMLSKERTLRTELELALKEARSQTPDIRLTEQVLELKRELRGFKTAERTLLEEKTTLTSSLERTTKEHTHAQDKLERMSREWDVERTAFQDKVRSQRSQLEGCASPKFKSILESTIEELRKKVNVLEERVQSAEALSADAEDQYRKHVEVRVCG